LASHSFCDWKKKRKTFYSSSRYKVSLHNELSAEIFFFTNVVNTIYIGEARSHYDALLQWKWIYLTFCSSINRILFVCCCKQQKKRWNKINETKTVMCNVRVCSEEVNPRLHCNFFHIEYHWISQKMRRSSIISIIFRKFFWGSYSSLIQHNKCLNKLFKCFFCWQLRLQLLHTPKNYSDTLVGKIFF
jgi:hypothetical protein